MQNSDLDNLIKSLGKLPGVGARSARRVALHLLRAPEKHLSPLISALQAAHDSIQTCAACGNLDSQNPCQICSDARRADGTLCMVADINDLWAFERTGAHRGRYHVLGGLLSGAQGIGIPELRIGELAARITADDIQEIIMALPPTVDGQTTQHVVEEQLRVLVPTVRITRLAMGLPVGGAIEYVDEGTLRLAVSARR